MSFYGFDPKKLSEEEIIRKLTELNERIVFIDQNTISYGVKFQLELIKDLLEQELNERTFKYAFDANNRTKSPVVVETDPDLRVEHNVKEDEIQRNGVERPETRKSWRPINQQKRYQSGQVGPKS